MKVFILCLHFVIVTVIYQVTAGRFAQSISDEAGSSNWKVHLP